MLESNVQTRIRLEAARLHWALWRNNNGACRDAKTGRLIRYGLANDSEALNRVFKSSDLIGIRPVLVTASMVGETIGQFAAIEVKRENWKYTGTDREAAQWAFGQKVIEFGGYFKFATGNDALIP